MHLLGDGGFLSEHCGLALRAIGNLESDVKDSLVDSHGPVFNCAEYQRQIAEQVFRFANSSSAFTPRQLSFVLRALQQVPLDDRRNFWLDVRACRRRPVVPYQQLAVAKLFANQDEYRELAVKAVISAIRFAIRVRGDMPADAFTKLDTNRTGTLRKAELLEGIKWLGVKSLTPHQFDELFRYIDKDDDGIISLDEFKVCFAMDEMDEEAIAAAREAIDADLLASAAPAEVMAAEEPDTAGSYPQPPSMENSGRYSLNLRTHEHFQRVWEGSSHSGELVVWRPQNVESLQSSMLGGVTYSICLGYFALSTRSRPAPSTCYVLEVGDATSKGLFADKDGRSLIRFVNIVFPRPLQYRLQMEVRMGDETLYVWEPIPPSMEYVALGCVTTSTADPPPSEEGDLRCVPREWTTPGQASMIWCRADPRMSSGPAEAIWANTRAPGTFAASATEPGLLSLKRLSFHAEMPKGELTGLRSRRRT